MKEYRIKDFTENKNYLDRIRINTIKLFIDGVFESGTALISTCIKYYLLNLADIKCECDSQINSSNLTSPNNTNFVYTPENLQKIVDFCYKESIQIHCHSIGDLATSSILDSLEKSKNNQTNYNSEINYIAHLQLTKHRDIERFKKLNIGASFSPLWFIEDDFTPRFLEIIGEDRMSEIYPIKEFLGKNVVTAFGSDWPVSEVNPLHSIEAAITHKPIGFIGYEKEPFIKDQRLSLLDAIKCYTIESARLLNLDKCTGSIEVGKFFDFIVLDRNIFNIKTEEIHMVKIEKTFLAGRLVYQKNS